MRAQGPLGAQSTVYFHGVGLDVWSASPQLQASVYRRKIHPLAILFVSVHNKVTVSVYGGEAVVCLTVINKHKQKGFSHPTLLEDPPPKHTHTHTHLTLLGSVCCIEESL